jgi:hypothetical protein
MLFERKSLNDLLTETPELRVDGDWLCLNVDTGMSWPTKPQAFTFEGHELWVMPYTTDNYPGLAMNRPADLNRDDAWAVLHRSLSLLSWTQDSGATVAHMSGGNLPHMMGLTKKFGGAIQDSFDLSDLPQIHEERGRIALALMREGRGLNHPAYAFLSFYRALETAIPNGQARGTWITEQIYNIEGHRAKEALAKLAETVDGDIGIHLRDSDRHAIAHAKADPIINPDDPRDARRLQAELPIIEGLAVLAIDQHLGIQTRRKVWQEHLYELRGWKLVFGEEIIADVLAGNPPAEGQEVDAPIINVRLRQSTPFTTLEGMLPLQAAFGAGRVEVVYRSTDGLVDLIFWLNFADERLEFSLQESIVPRDDGSVGAAKNGKELERFLRDYIANGELQIWDAESGKLISRCDAFIPRNFFLNIDAANAAIDAWDAIIAEREQVSLG